MFSYGVYKSGLQADDIFMGLIIFIIAGVVLSYDDWGEYPLGA